MHTGLNENACKKYLELTCMDFFTSIKQGPVCDRALFFISLDNESEHPGMNIKDYASVHQHWGNILMHVLSAPFFMAGTLIGTLKLLSGDWLGVVASFIVVVMAFALQGIGHKLEENPAPPFVGPLDMIRRIFAEQFYRFWVFLVMKLQGLH